MFNFTKYPFPLCAKRKKAFFSERCAKVFFEKDVKDKKRRANSMNQP